MRVRVHAEVALDEAHRICTGEPAVLSQLIEQAMGAGQAEGWRMSGRRERLIVVV